AKRLATLAQPGGDLREHAVSGGMAEAIVDLLEVVDVDETERQRRVGLFRVQELALETLVEVTVVPEARERVREGEPHRAERTVRRALVQRDGEQRADERHGQ